jgi:hypothetical protein
MPSGEFRGGNPLERKVGNLDTCRFYVHLPRTQIDLNSSMSPIRGGCQGKNLVLPLREERDGGLHPARSPFGEVVRPVLQTDRSQSTVSLDGFLFLRLDHFPPRLSVIPSEPAAKRRLFYPAAVE